MNFEDEDLESTSSSPSHLGAQGVITEPDESQIKHTVTSALFGKVPRRRAQDTTGRRGTLITLPSSRPALLRATQAELDLPEDTDTTIYCGSM